MQGHFHHDLVSLSLGEEGRVFFDDERISELRQVACVKHDIDNGSDNLCYTSFVHTGLLRHQNSPLSRLLEPPSSGMISRFRILYASASAPATTSSNSVVIDACRTRFICNVSAPIISSAFLDALSIAVMRAPNSLASASRSAL